MGAIGERTFPDVDDAVRDGVGSRFTAGKLVFRFTIFWEKSILIIEEVREGVIVIIEEGETIGRVNSGVNAAAARSD